MVPTAGTEVMEKKTPTSAEDFDVVSESTPATPASSAMTNDHASRYGGVSRLTADHKRDL